MTDDDKGLIILLTEWDKRESKELSPSVAHHIAGHIIAMKANIEAQAAEIERLREALGWFINDKRFVVQVGGNPNVVPSMIDAATKIYFGETLHVAETCKENGETFT
jgi:hypothetical protein